MEKQEVEEEILALQSIFGDDVEVKSNGTLVTYGRDSNQVTLTIGSKWRWHCNLFVLLLSFRALSLNCASL